MKTTIEIPDDLFRAAKAAALVRGQTLKQLLTAAVEHELKGIQAASFPGVESQPQVARAQAFRIKLEELAQHNAATWGNEKPALQQLQEDRDARGS